MSQQASTTWLLNYSQNWSWILESVRLVLLRTAEIPRCEIICSQISSKQGVIWASQRRMRPASMLIFPSNCSTPDPGKHSPWPSLHKSHKHTDANPSLNSKCTTFRTCTHIRVLTVAEELTETTSFHLLNDYTSSRQCTGSAQIPQKIV